MMKPHDERPDMPAPAHKARHQRSFVDALISAADGIHGFKLVRGAIGRHIPGPYRRPVIALLALGAVLATAFTIADPSHIIAEWYGPDVVIGVAGTDVLSGMGKKSLLYEFVFGNHRLAKQVDDDGDVHKLFAGPPLVVLTPECNAVLSGREMRVYRLIVIAQNSGHKTAKDYEMMISFSSDDDGKPDPGIRILGNGTDALRVGYLYQQESRNAIKATLDGCSLLATFSSELLPEEPPAKTGNEATSSPVKIPELTRDTYKKLGLTRDLLILSGTLEAHLFQAATVLVAAPKDLRKFATLFHVECSNCSWFYKTISYAQVVGTADAGPVAKQ